MLMVTLLMFLVERLMASQNSLTFKGSILTIGVPSVKRTHVSFGFEVETFGMGFKIRLLFLLYQMNKAHKAHSTVRMEEGLL
jgi:hypothetical protein